MKRSRHIRLVMMSTVPLFLTACDQPPSEVGVFRSVEECAASGEFTESDCRLQIAELQEQHAKEAPKFATREECVATYGAEACQETRSSSTTSSSRPSSSTMSSSARPSGTPAPTGTAADGTTPVPGAEGAAVADAATAATAGGGSYWMPMIAGYMMGRMGGFNQPVYGQPGASMFRTRTGETVGPGVQTLPPSKASAISATGRTSAAVSRGGFGSRMSSSAAG